MEMIVLISQKLAEWLPEVPQQDFSNSLSFLMEESQSGISCLISCFIYCERLAINFCSFKMRKTNWLIVLSAAFVVALKNDVNQRFVNFQSLTGLSSKRMNLWEDKLLQGISYRVKITHEEFLHYFRNLQSESEYAFRWSTCAIRRYIVKKRKRLEEA